MEEKAPRGARVRNDNLESRILLVIGSKKQCFFAKKKSAQIAALYPVSSGNRPVILRFCTVFDKSTLRVQIEIIVLIAIIQKKK